MTTIEHPYSAASIVIENTGRRAAARVRALTPIITAHGVHATTARGYGIDRSGARTLSLYGDRHAVTTLKAEIIPDLIARMEAAAGDALGRYNTYLRTVELCRSDLPGMRRAFRVAYLQAWGQAYADRADSAYHRRHPEARADWHEQLPDPTTGAGDVEPDPGTLARHAVDRFDFWHFDRAVSMRNTTQDALDAYYAACRAAGADPLTGTAAPTTPRPATLTFGPLVHTPTESTVMMTLANDADRADLRAGVLAPIIRALGAGVGWQTEDRYGRRSGELGGPRQIIETVYQRLPGILEDIETAARTAVRTTYGPYLDQCVDRAPWEHAHCRRLWADEYMQAWAEAFAERLDAAVDRRPGAGRPGVELRDELLSEEELLLSMHRQAPARGRAAVDELDAAGFVILALAVGIALPATTIPTIADQPEPETPPAVAPSTRVTLSDTRGRAVMHLDALRPIFQAHHLQPRPIPAGPREHRSITLALDGDPQLGLCAARTMRTVLPLMDRHAALELRRHGLAGDPGADDWRARFLTAWGHEFAAAITVTEASTRTTAPSDIQHLARAAVGGLDPRILTSIAARIAARTDPARRTTQRTAYLAVGAGACYTAAWRTRAITVLAHAHGLAAGLADCLDEDLPREVQRDLVRLDGPTDLVATFLTALPALIEEADQAAAAALPTLDTTIATSRTYRRPDARAVRREMTAGSIVLHYATAYAGRLTAADAGDQGAARRTAPPRSPQATAAYAAVDRIEPTRFTIAAAATGAAEAAIDQAWHRRTILTPTP